MLVGNFPFTFLAGEYVGLTGARLDGAEMLACGLVTHFVSSTVHFLPRPSTALVFALKNQIKPYTSLMSNIYLSHHAYLRICLNFSAQKSNKAKYLSCEE